MKKYFFTNSNFSLYHIDDGVCDIGFYKNYKPHGFYFYFNTNLKDEIYDRGYYNNNIKYSHWRESFNFKYYL